MEGLSFNASKQQRMMTLNSLFAELTLDQAIRDFKMEQIKKEIDLSLQYRNKEEFLRLTEKLKEFSL